MTERDRKWTLLEVLDWTRGHFESKGIESPRLDAEVLLAHVLKTKRIMLYARFDQPMQGKELTEMRALVARRAAGEPIAHLTGERELWSLGFEVSADVLIPRPDTEILVEVALRRAPNARTVVDVGTGSGAVLIAVLSELKEARGVGLEVSEPALEVARRNLARHGLEERAELIRSNLLSDLRIGAPVELMVANLPYIPTPDIGQLALEVRGFEPHLALDGGPDGLDLIRSLITAARPTLAPGAMIALEAAPDQSEAISSSLEAAGYTDIEVTPDLAGHPRVTSARWPGK